ncbi:MAG: DinB family protein [Nitrospinae bacterium]|nr:DinB family protein [Nitrospinota bacterium]
MDDALQLAIEMSEQNWTAFKNTLKDLTPDEIDWRPLPQANNIHALMKHLRVAEEWYVTGLEQGEESPYQDAASVEQLTDSVPLNFEQNLKELEEWHNRFIAALRGTTLADLKRKTFLSQVLPGQSPRPANTLLLREIMHLAAHGGQIRTIRNLYRKTRGEQGLFLPQNPLFAE